MLRAAPPAALALALLAAAPIALADALPPAVLAEMQRARLPAGALAVVVQEVGTGRPVVSLNADVPVNPASLSKLFTTAAALDLLGPAWTWSTPVWFDGPVRQGVLDGSLVLQGSGDPKLVVERAWLLLRRVQQSGVREIARDIVLDASAFAVPESSAAEFDGDATRPYNVQPHAALMNYGAVVYTFVPDPARGVAAVLHEPPLAGLAVQAQVPLVNTPCADWAGGLKASFEPGRTRFAGAYPASCGERGWPVADPEPRTYPLRFVEGLWREMGGRLGGQVRFGSAPTGVPPVFESRSPPLVEVVREINKFSNNVMAEQLFLTLARQREPSQPATAEAARAELRRWLAARMGELGPAIVIDNGSGLSRRTRVDAHLLARLLMQAHDSPWMSELMSSLPITGTDGTMRRSRTTPGRAHLKTGSLRDVAARAGYVLSDSGRRYVLVAVVHHENAPAARPVLEALVQWVMRDAPTRARGGG